MYAGEGNGQLGAWYNNWGDLWGDIKAITGAIVGGSGSGVNTTAVTSPGGIYSNDIAIVRAWADNARANGTVPTRIPNSAHSEVVNNIIYALGAGSSNAGKLGARHTGAGTYYPDDTSKVYELAPSGVLAADARIQAGLADDQTGTLLDIMKSMGLAPGIDGNDDNATDWVAVAKWSAIGLGAVIVLPSLLSAVRRR